MINLKNILKGNVVIVCVGNIDRGDDGFGPRLAAILKEKKIHNVIDAGMAPENYTGVVKKLKPDTIIIVDAVYFEGKPGEIRLFSGEDIRFNDISTHGMSLKFFIEYMKNYTKAGMYLLGAKPVSNKLGDGLSREVAGSLEAVKSLFLDR